MSKSTETDLLNENKIYELLSDTPSTDQSKIREILSKAKELEGLNLHEIIHLLSVDNPLLLKEIFDSARQVKETIYGRRLVLFVPLYISNFCCNDCLYCAFRTSNPDIIRRSLRQDEIAEETRCLVSQGHKRVLLVTGEAYPEDNIDYIRNSIDTIYKTKVDHGEIRRINVNISPLTVEMFKELKSSKIGTYQLFQETYHRETYEQVHPSGKKHDFDWRITTMDRALKAGIDDVGIGVLFGLYDWRFEILALFQHINHLEECFGIGPHTISVPRIEPALGSELAGNPPFKVSDSDYARIIAILRLAVPYTGIIMSTRETPGVRRKTYELGVSQISAGSRTNPGGYSNQPFEGVASQFQLGDHRSLDEVIRDIAGLGYIPSFCTACYRLGRTGEDFMKLAKPGDIKSHCDPNALSTFLEYLIDYASDDTRTIGEKLVALVLDEMDNDVRNVTEKLLIKIKSGSHDIYC